MVFPNGKIHELIETMQIPFGNVELHKISGYKSVWPDEAIYSMYLIADAPSYFPLATIFSRNSPDDKRFNVMWPLLDTEEIGKFELNLSSLKSELFDYLDDAVVYVAEEVIKQLGVDWPH
jgi:hypothetical protein